MDWTQIIVAVFGLLGVIDLGRLIFFKSSKRKATAEAVNVEQQNDSTAVETLKSAMELLQAQLDYAQGQVAAKEEVIQIKDQRIITLESQIQALFDDMCVHKGCKLRKPHQGQGRKWYEMYRDDPSLGCDYLSVEWLLKQWRAKSKAEETTEDTEESHGDDK